MKVSVFRFQQHQWTSATKSKPAEEQQVTLALSFGAKHLLEQNGLFREVKSKFPNAIIAMCSTAGEIFQEEVLDNSLVVVGIQLDQTTLEAVSLNIKNYKNSYDAGMALGKKLPVRNLSYVLLLSDGNLVNGSELLKGINTWFDKKVLITGGLAGDGPNFQSTLVGLNEQPAEGTIAAIGFYGKNIQVTHSSQGGWDMFGLEKTITRSSSNVLYEIGGQNALDLYKAYLGAEVENLPGAALLYPLAVIVPGTTQPVVRTILSINNEEKSMTFAGDIPEGSKVRFMKANFNKLTMSAADAAKQTIKNTGAYPEFALLISCVGRKLILGEKTAEEVKAVSAAFNHSTVLAGFYSYGELSPFNDGGACQLHNQTMTITSFFETK